jgi:hypothetical protein
VRRLAALLLVLSLLAACGSEEDGGEGAAASEQLGYLDPDSSLVVRVDLRWEEENWESLRAIADRVLEDVRGVAGPEVPADAEAALTEIAKGWTLSFDEDVRPRLTGHLLIGMTLEADSGDAEEESVVAYRAEEGGMREIVDQVLDNSRLRPVPGHDDAVVSEEGIGVVGDDTLVATPSREGTIAAIERAEAGRGFPAELLDAAEEGTGVPDPLVLATATPDLARAFFDGADVDRARAEVPYLAAVERMDAAVDVSEEGVEATAQVVTSAGRLSEQQLPLGPPGEVELPVAEGAVLGGSLDQSRITTFAASVARSLFADSEFVATVEETERELGIRFEEEVLRQFDCPSVSVFEPEGGAALGTAGRFSARSCVRDPERMRELLPELAPRLPRILRAMRGLSGEGLLGLLMLAPDAPLAPGLPLLQVGVEPLAAGGREQLYEVSGLRESDTGEEVFAGPDRVVFGMVGDDFVVGSDLSAAREAAELETEPAGESAASVLRMPPELAIGAMFGSDQVNEVLGRNFGDLEAWFSATSRATRAHARMPLQD